MAPFEPPGWPYRRVYSPRVYLAFGISGAPQHIAGIRSAGKVVAVDTDARAPILKVDLAVIADLHEVIAGAHRETAGPTVQRDGGASAMRIAVCIKWVPDPEFPLQATAAGLSLESPGLVHMVNPVDMVACEAAVRLKEQTSGHASVFTVAAPDADAGLRSALALGGDEAVRIEPADGGLGGSLAPALVWPRQLLARRLTSSSAGHVRLTRGRARYRLSSPKPSGCP